MHVLTAGQFDPDEITEIFALADKFRKMSRGRSGQLELLDTHRGKQICSLFYEPSTRTRLSFETAAEKLGMSVVSTENASEFSSATKGETIEDTMRVLNEYGYSAVVIRSKERGAVAKAANVSKVPILNAGDGAGEHPTQALLDAYTILRRHGRLDNLKIVMGGDLKYGRTVRSLCQLLAKYSNNQITFVSVPELQIGEDVKVCLSDHAVKFSETNNMKRAFNGADVVYWTRLQKERLENLKAVQGEFVIDKDAVKVLPKSAIIMHPLPRVGEIHTDVDSDPRAVYFEQAGNGLYIRMALLDRIAI